MKPGLPLKTVEALTNFEANSAVFFVLFSFGFGRREVKIRIESLRYVEFLVPVDFFRLYCGSSSVWLLRKGIR